MSDHSSAAELKSRGDANDLATFEFAVPGDWPPGLAIAFAELMDKALQDGFPIVVPVRQDATAGANQPRLRRRTNARQESWPGTGRRAAGVIYGNVPTSPVGASSELQATTA